MVLDKKEEKPPLGSVLVMGGGIAGIQASLDLSASGYKVYLLEKQSALGGHMAMLDKTFPTNDCAMCTMSPRLTTVARDRNVEILTLADLVTLEGEPGRMTAMVRLRPRFVDLQKCTGCGECVQACPVELDDEFNQGLVKRKAIHRLYPQAVPSAFVIQRDERPRCMRSCPIGTNPQGYIALVKQRRFHEALQTLHDTNPLPSVCARVCHHPCEVHCARAAYDAPVSVRALKRFLTDYCATHPPTPEVRARLAAVDERIGRGQAGPTGKRVAIVGSGPAGLTAADHLARRGHAVVVLEALDVPGGMLRAGIPGFRLPVAALEQDIEGIRRLGVDIRCNWRLGREATLDSLRKDYDAVLVAIGAHRGRRLDVEGEDAPNVYQGVDFLRSVNIGNAAEVGRRVAIVGGGNVAIDVARAARRLGAEQVTLLYRRSEAEMPAIPEEVEEALQEGVKLQVLTAPLHVAVEEGRAVGLECIRMRLAEPDDSGRCRPVPIPDTDFFVEADTIILAVGQEVDRVALGGKIALHRELVGAEPTTLTTSLDGVFAAGDMVTGPQTVTGAMALGRRAAISIDNYLSGRPLDEGQTDPTPPELPPLEREHLRRPRTRTPRVSESLTAPDERIRSFDEVTVVLDEETAVAQAERCLVCGACSDCRQCERACEAGAIRLDDTERVRVIDMGGVILADGYLPYDAKRRGEFGWGRYPNVVTSLQFERLLSACGPTGGKVLRPGDAKEAKRIAFIQCVGSRDTTTHGNEYCSGVCCMQATKQAMIAMEHTENLASTIFMIDVRAHGKGYEVYYDRARREGVRYVRCMVSAVRQDFKTGDLTVEYFAEDGSKRTEVFDVVVLSVGLESRCKAEAAAVLGVELDEYGFVRTAPDAPGVSSRPGVVACGAALGPKDIPESVTDASAAAAVVGCSLAPARSTEVAVTEYPPERDVSAEPPRVGVFVCDCGNNIAGVVDVEGVTSFAKTLPDVVHAERNVYTCSPQGLAMIRKAIEAEQLNRVVVASCTPRTHAATFQDAMMQSGLNKYLFEMANIRDQCSWVHGTLPFEATVKARALLAAAVAKARLLRPLQERTQSVTHAALVVGGGLAGMVAASNLADQGFDVHLVERAGELGGNMLHVRRTLDGLDVPALASRLIRRVEEHPRIRVYLNSNLVKHQGSVGNFESQIDLPDGKRLQVRHGVTLVACGAEMYEPVEHGHGKLAGVITQRELERRTGDASFTARRVVMIQCVGCRNAERPYCSRICCVGAVKNAIELKQRNPDCAVTVLYRDVRTFGLTEKHYLRARRAGVIFLRFDEEHPPEVQPDGSVRFTDLNLGREMTLQADLVVLSAAIIGRKENHALSEVLRVPLTTDGFFMEAHVKLRPVDFACEGVFLAGMAHWPKLIPETITHALAAAGRAATVLSKDVIRAGGAISVVDRERCAACLTCVRLCPYGVPAIKDGAADIEPTACQGCGICAAECPAHAVSLEYFTGEQMEAAVCALLREGRSEVKETVKT